MEEISKIAAHCRARGNKCDLNLCHGKLNIPSFQSPGNWSTQKNRQRTKLGPLTPRSSLQFTPKKSPMAANETPARGSPNPMTTPSHLRPTENGIFEIKDEDDSDGGKAEFSALLFTDMPSGDKENVGHQNYRIPKHSKSDRGKSAYQMRKEEGKHCPKARFKCVKLLQ